MFTCSLPLSPAPLPTDSRLPRSVKGASQDPKLSIQIVPNSEAEKQNMSVCRRVVHHAQPRFMPDTVMTKKVGVSFRVLNMVTGMVTAKDSKGKAIGLGLCLKSRSQEAFVPDYCKVVVRGENTFYEYSDGTLQVRALPRAEGGVPPDPSSTAPSDLPASLPPRLSSRTSRGPPGPEAVQAQVPLGL